MSGLRTTLYNIFLKRSSTYALTIITGTFFFERTYDLITEKLFESINKGKLWKDIKHKYEE
uniref:cytochrome b-c1 complex subunit 9 n=1 Tax=Vespula vulgaris TaxID=7454 RepID=UPI00223B7FBB|nr:cytochrome b-c1 complex subunit 9 [Vespula vulgaris]